MISTFDSRTYDRAYRQAYDDCASAFHNRSLGMIVFGIDERTAEYYRNATFSTGFMQGKRDGFLAAYEDFNS